MGDLFQDEFKANGARQRRRSVTPGSLNPGGGSGSKDIELRNLKQELAGIDVDAEVLLNLAVHKQMNRANPMKPPEGPPVEENRFNALVNTLSTPFDTDTLQKPMSQKKRSNSFFEGRTRRLSRDSTGSKGSNDSGGSSGGRSVRKNLESALLKTRKNRSSILFVGGASVPELGGSAGPRREETGKVSKENGPDISEDLVELLTRQHPFLINPLSLKFVHSHFEEMYEKAVIESRHLSLRISLILACLTAVLVLVGGCVRCTGLRIMQVFLSSIALVFLFLALLVLHCFWGKGKLVTRVCQIGLITGWILVVIVSYVFTWHCEDDNNPSISFDILVYDVLVWMCYVWLGIPFRYAWIGPITLTLLLAICSLSMGEFPLDSWVYFVFKFLLLNMCGAYFCYFSELEGRRYIYTFAILVESTHIVKSESRRAEEIVRAQLPPSILKDLLVSADKKEAKDEGGRAHVKFTLDTNGNDSEELERNEEAGPVTERDMLHEWMFNPPDYFNSVQMTSIVFVEWSNFSADEFTPVQVAQILNEFFQALEDMAVETGIDKIKTSGNLFMGMPEIGIANMTHPHCACLFASRVLSRLDTLREEIRPDMTIRLGLASGPVVAGILGTVKWSYDVWGDTVNTASRMMSTAEPNRCQADHSTTLFVEGSIFNFSKKSNVYMKGKGKVDAYVLQPPSEDEILQHHLFHLGDNSGSEAEAYDDGDLVIEWKHMTSRTRKRSSSPPRAKGARTSSQLSAPPALHMGRSEDSLERTKCSSRVVSWLRRRITAKTPSTPNVQLPYTLNKLTMRFTKGYEENYSIYAFSTGNNSALRLLFCSVIFGGFSLLSGIVLDNELDSCLVTPVCYVSLWVVPLFFGPLTVFMLYISLSSYRWHDWGLVVTYTCILVVTLYNILVTDEMMTKYKLIRTSVTWTGCIPILLRIRYPYVGIVYLMELLFVFVAQAAHGIDYFSSYLTVLYYIVCLGVLGYRTEALGRTLFMTNTLLLFEKKHIKEEQLRSVRFLNNLLPRRVVNRLFEDITALRNDTIGRELHVESISSCSVIFTDIVGFTRFCNNNSAETVVNHLHRLFALFDELAKIMEIEKVKMLGDCYVGLSLSAHDKTHAVRMIEFAFHIVAVINEYNRQYGTSFHMRTGIASGSALGVLIGQRKFVYDIIGDTAQMAASLEQGSRVDGVNIDSNTFYGMESLIPLKSSQNLNAKDHDEHIRMAIYEIFRKAERNALAKKLLLMKSVKYPSPFVLLNGEVILASQSRKEMSDAQYVSARHGYGKTTAPPKSGRRNLFRRKPKKKVIE